MDSPETQDVLSRTLQIIQLRDGHRAASDDLLLAWTAARSCPDASTVLDLGSGKGTVALLLARRLPNCTIVGVEAVAESYRLAQRNAALNGLAQRYHPIWGDFRDASLLQGSGPFDLICGAPPFMPPGSGVMPRESTRVAGRFQLRGGVEAYAEAAACHLDPAGWVVLLMPGQDRLRAERAVQRVGLN